VWVDKTGNGKFSPRELETMDQLGISNIVLIGRNINIEQSGNTILDVSTVTLKTGKSAPIAAVNLTYDANSERRASTNSGSSDNARADQSMHGWETSEASTLNVAAKLIGMSEHMHAY